MNTVITNKIYAKYDEKTIRVYQAYSDNIATQAVELQTFGDEFNMSRMTWIKPSFLWMMYRSGWASKDGQNRILGIDIKREAFETIVNQAVLSTYSKNNYTTKEEWQEHLKNSEVRCQWDPDRDIYGNPIHRRAIQLGIKGSVVENYINKWICNIEDITQYVTELRKIIDNNKYDDFLLPKEREYFFSNSNINQT